MHDAIDYEDRAEAWLENNCGTVISIQTVGHDRRNNITRTNQEHETTYQDCRTTHTEAGRWFDSISPHTSRTKEMLMKK
jgi:hypothetical protein